jgi:hypothetical protein
MIATGDDPEVARPGEKEDAEEPAEQDPEGKPTQPQIRKLFAMAKKAKIEDVPAFVKQITGKFSSSQLKVKDMQGLYDTLDTIIATGGGTLVTPNEAVPEAQHAIPDEEKPASERTSEENHAAAGLDEPEEAAK